MRRRRHNTDDPQTGTDLQVSLLRWAKARGWLVKMDRRSHMARTESSPGFPDLILVWNRADGAVWVIVECKSRYEKLSRDQLLWRVAIEERTPWVHYRVWRPQDFDTAKAVLAALEELRWE